MLFDNGPELFTRSYDREWNRIVFLKVMEGKEAIDSMNDRQTCKMILIQEGNGILECNHLLLHITAPAVLLLNQEDSFIGKESDLFKVSAVFFQPTVLNDKFDYKFLRGNSLRSLEGTTLYQDLTLLSSFYGIDKPKRTQIMLDTASFVMLKRLLDKIKMELVMQKDGYWPCRSRSYFIELLFSLEGLRNEKTTEEISFIIEKNDNHLIYEILRYLNQNIDQRITLEMMEKYSGYNRNKINSEFQKELNTTVMRYFIRMRMKLAAAIIRDTEIPMAEVALRVGYPDVGYFNRTFKSHYGKTPGEYRNT